MDLYYAQIDHLQPLTTAGEELDDLDDLLLDHDLSDLSQGCKILSRDRSWRGEAPLGRAEENLTYSWWNLETAPRARRLDVMGGEKKNKNAS